MAEENPNVEITQASQEGFQVKTDELLQKYGGFNFLETTVDGLKEMNPKSKARKNIFLGESSKANERESLANRLELWIDMLENSGEVDEMITKCSETVDANEALLNKNVQKALEASKELETSYRALNLFFSNTGKEKLRNIAIVNADMDQLADLDNPIFFNEIRDEIDNCYDRLDMRQNYSMLLVPGYIGSGKALNKWARMAHKNKVMLMTDYRHLESVDSVIDLFEGDDLSGSDIYLSNVMMSCNYLIGREKSAEHGEEEHIFVPPSSSLAGRLYSSLMSQPTAGKKHGELYESSGTAFDLKKREIGQMDKLGLIPSVDEFGKVLAFSAKTLFNGDNIGLQTYSVVRVFDYVSKVLVDFLNRKAFEKWDSNVKADLRSQIVKFLDNIKGPKGLIENWEIKKIERDPNVKDKINVDILMKPYFPAKTFMVQLEGTKGEGIDEVTWESDYANE